MAILSGKRIIVTGAGRGLGRAYALRFAAEGAKVVVNDFGTSPQGEGRDPAVANAVVEEIRAQGGEALPSFHDVTVQADVDAMVQVAVGAWGGVDGLVCSAGILFLGNTILDVKADVWERVMASNVRGTMLPMQAVAKRMVEQKTGGRILTTTSMVGLQGNANLIDYATSKAAIYGMSRTAALELEAHGINVNILAPMAWTRLTSSIPAINAIPNGEQVLSPNFVADVVLFLMSDAARGITGHVVDVGGPQLRVHRLVPSQGGMPAAGRWTTEELAQRWASLST